MSVIAAENTMVAARQTSFGVPWQPSIPNIDPISKSITNETG
jgi:hypothetical protein